MLQLPLSEIKKIEHISQNMDDCISFAQGALRIGGIPQPIKQHISNLLTTTDKTDHYQSAWGLSVLREKLAVTLNAHHKTTLNTENIIISHGSIGALSVLFLALLKKGDMVILPEPTYPAYAKLAHIVGATTHFVSSLDKTDPMPTWHLDIEQIKDAATLQTKMIVFSNPCNPTGMIVNKKILYELADWCEKRKIYLIVDEVYDDYIFEGTFTSITSLVQHSKFIIRTGSFSKNFSMSGWRIGYMVLPSDLCPCIGQVQDALLNCPNVFAQHATLYALDHPELILPFQEIIKHNNNLTQQLLDPLIKKGKLSFQAPQGGFYLFIKLNIDMHPPDFCFDLLQREKVAIIPGNAFGPSGRSFFRLCFARETDLVKRGIARIVSYFDL